MKGELKLTEETETGTCREIVSLKQLNHFENVECGGGGTAFNVIYFFVNFREEGFGQSQAGA